MGGSWLHPSPINSPNPTAEDVLARLGVLGGAARDVNRWTGERTLGAESFSDPSELCRASCSVSESAPLSAPRSPAHLGRSDPSSRPASRRIQGQFQAEGPGRLTAKVETARQTTSFFGFAVLTCVCRIDSVIGRQRLFIACSEFHSIWFCLSLSQSRVNSADRQPPPAG